MFLIVKRRPLMIWEKKSAIGAFMATPPELRERMTRITPRAINPDAVRGQVALITGATGGLGRAYAFAMSRMGMKVVIAARNKQAVNELAETINNEGGIALSLPQYEVTDNLCVMHNMGYIEHKLGPIDLVVNNAAVGGPIMPWSRSYRTEDWWETINTNYIGIWLVAIAASERMKRRKRGRIINIASSTVETRPRELAAYAFSKWLVVTDTKEVAPEYSKEGLGIFAVHPGTVRTGMTERMIQSPRAPKLLKRIFENGLDVSPERAAEFILYVASGAVDHLACEFLCRGDGVLAG